MIACFLSSLIRAVVAPDDFDCSTNVHVVISALHPKINRPLFQHPRAFVPNAARAYDEGIILGLRLQVPLQSLGDLGSYLRSGRSDGVDFVYETRSKPNAATKKQMKKRFLSTLNTGYPLPDRLC